MKRADGWWWRGLGTAALIVVTALPLWATGWLLAHLLDLFGGPP